LIDAGSHPGSPATRTGAAPTGDGGAASPESPPPGTAGGGAADLGVVPPVGGGGQKSAVGPQGGSVTLLHMGLTGDTRPSACEDTAGYPTAVINAIADQFEMRGVDFVLDLGDHMYVCNDDLSVANTQMGLYMQATQHFSGTWFMTMGNHECWKGPCLSGSTNANYVAFMKALKPVSPTTPYYSFDISTMKGLMTFVVIADNAWDATQSSWLDARLTTADAKATYTIIARHHPEGDTTIATNADSLAIIRAHKFSLFLTGHEHTYKHLTADQGRDLVFGAGGAPLLAGGAFHGYVILDQQATGNLTLTVYDVSTNTVQDTWTATPN
jgi:hypothetical protein